MLNISPTSQRATLEPRELRSLQRNTLPQANRMFSNWLLVSMLIGLVFLFLPWTQNIQSKGKVTTLYPEERPQKIYSTIAGSIERWYVREGEVVQRGDTIATLAEVKTDYFDPDLIPRTRQQVSAKNQAAVAYGEKANALSDQIQALRQELVLKREQLEQKIQQAQLKIQNQEAQLEQAQLDQQIADFQYRRTDTLYQRGIKSLSDLETKRLKQRETQVKLTNVQNKLAEARNDLNIAKLELNNINNEYASKIAKTESERFSTLSNQYSAAADVQKLESQAASYERRNRFYTIVAPQDGLISKTLRAGLGEIVKEGDMIASIVPTDPELAVEIYVRPVDLPLIQSGQEVRFIFDGWPAIVFSGWPNANFGTFTGEIVGIDTDISENGKYRLLVAPAEGEKMWPEALRPGGGAQGIVLLENVPLWYEIWRQLNGFPPEFYQSDGKTDGEKKDFKAPVKKVAK